MDTLSRRHVAGAQMTLAATLVALGPCNVRVHVHSMLARLPANCKGFSHKERTQFSQRPACSGALRGHLASI